jgi:hypothetical protein
MRPVAGVILLVLTSAAPLLAQEPETRTLEERRSWLSRMMHPFRNERLPEYTDARLRGLVLDLQLSPQPVKLSEVRQLEVLVTLTNKSKHPIELDFPNEERIEIVLLTSAEAILTKWSDNHAFADTPGTVLINPQEHIEYAETIATRDLAPNKVFICEVFFPRFPELRVRQKFLTAP